MPENVKPMQLRRRIAPSVPLHLELEDQSGDKLIRNLRLSIDFNAACLVQARIGKSLIDGDTWDAISPESLSVIFYAALLANHPEYRTKDEDGEDTDEGLEVVRSFIDPGNCLQIQDACLDAFVMTLSPARQAKIAESRRKLKELREKLERGEDVPNAPTATTSTTTAPTGNEPTPEIPTPEAAVSAS
jgi:hypothetical protein